MNSDLTWLPNSLFKDLPTPIIIFEESADQSYSGYYTWGTTEIVVVEDEEMIPSTIAHELCHLIQYWTGKHIDETSFESTYDNYEEQIHKYFTTSTSEYEALLFEYKYSKNDVNEWWLRKLVHRN